ncbi:MAG TPA: Smr/MutS family protein [Acidobacteriaceae bacterium]|nr:Smr/MutS family protein [Acidobacteriaceae bacterium]
MTDNSNIPGRLTERGGAALEWERLRERLATGARSGLGRDRVLALEPSADAAWIGRQQQRTAEMRRLVAVGAAFDFRGLLDPADLLDQARIDGAALEPLDLLSLLMHAERVDAWRRLVITPPADLKNHWPAIDELSAPLIEHDLGNLLRALRGKIEPDGSLADDASPELARIRRALARQHRIIEESLRKTLAQLSEGGSTQSDLITVRGERFVIPVKAEFKRKVRGILHGSSSSGQTVYIEPMETVEQNNELARLLDDEQAEIHRILVAMTRSVALHAIPLTLGAEILSELDAHQAIAIFAQDLECIRPVFLNAPAANAQASGEESPATGTGFEIVAARHPLLELRLRAQTEVQAGRIVPITVALPIGQRQMIISGPNTGGKSVALKTVGLLSVMAQAGVPVPAGSARLPVFTAIFTDIGDAQSIEQNLSTFSAHIRNLDRIVELTAGPGGERSLVLIDELGSATDPDEGSALAVAVAQHFLERRVVSIITTHLTALKVYAARHTGVLNAAVGFDETTLTPTYELRLGVPGASAGINIASRLGLDPAIVANARSQLTTQQADISRFLDELHSQLSAATAERAELAATGRKLNSERQRLQQEGRAEQQARTRELERKLESLLRDFESQLRDTVKDIDDKKIAQKIARDSALRIARLRREFSAQFQTTVAEHTADDNRAQSPGTKSDQPREPRVGDLVRLRSLNREGRVVRVIDANSLEVSFGTIKTRVPRSDIAGITPVHEPPAESIRRRGGRVPAELARLRGGITLSTSSGGDDMLSSEINVIGRTADEAESEVERFVERAFLAGLPRIRVVHGVGMGVLRRTLRDFLRKHPHVVSVTEPPYNEGGQGATIVELRQ